MCWRMFSYYPHVIGSCFPSVCFACSGVSFFLRISSLKGWDLIDLGSTTMDTGAMFPAGATCYMQHSRQVRPDLLRFLRKRSFWRRSKESHSSTATLQPRENRRMRGGPPKSKQGRGGAGASENVATKTGTKKIGEGSVAKKAREGISSVVA